MELVLNSKGLYSSWAFERTTRTLFDCGEGCASFLGNQIHGIDRICLSHGHTDHVSGLPTFINVRNSGFGSREKPLDIYYPEGDKHVESMLGYIDAAQKGLLRFPVNIQPVRAGFILPLNDSRQLRTFTTKHHSGLSLGWSVDDKRKKLAPEFAHLSQKEIQTGIFNKTIDRTKLMVPYLQPVLAYGLDSYTYDTNAIKGVETLIADSTFLNDDDQIHLNEDGTPGQLRRVLSHATVEEAIVQAKAAEVKKKLILAHFSPRYTPEEIDRVVQEQVRKHRPAFDVLALSHTRRPLELDLKPDKSAPER